MLKVLNGYAGIGGNRKHWKDVKVTAIEIDPEIAQVYHELYPEDEIIVGDAHEYLLNHFRGFPFIWLSPPCPTHSDIRRAAIQGGLYDDYVYPDMTLYQEIILLKHFSKGSWVIENVKPYYKPLIDPNFELGRHYFWNNFYVKPYTVKDDRVHNDILGSSEVYGFDLNGFDCKEKRKLLRNLVNPEIGLYLLNCALNKHEDINVGLFAKAD